MKEIKDLSTWNNILCSWIERLKIIRYQFSLKLTDRCKAISIKISIKFYTDTDKLILKYI